MPGMAGQLGGEAQAVGDDRQLAPAAARLELAGDRRGRSCWRPSRCSRRRWTRAPPRPRCEPSRRPGGARGCRTRAPAGCGRWRSRRRGSGRAGRSASSPTRSLRMVTAETPKRVASSATRTRPCSSTMRDDVLLAFAGEDVARGGAGWNGHASPLVRADDATGSTGVSFGFRGTVNRHRERNVKKVIEINRNMWQAMRADRPGRHVDRAPAPPASPPPAAPPGSETSRSRRVRSSRTRRSDDREQTRPRTRPGRRRQT